MAWLPRFTIPVHPCIFLHAAPTSTVIPAVSHPEYRNDCVHNIAFDKNRASDDNACMA